MNDIQWTRRQVGLTVESGRASAELACNVSIPDDENPSDEMLVNFVDDALETFLFHTSEKDLEIACSNNDCLEGSTIQGDLIQKGFEEGCDSTGIRIMFRSLFVTSFRTLGSTGFSIVDRPALLDMSQKEWLESRGLGE